MMFKRDLSVHKSEFQRNGYILLKDVISDEFMAYLKDFHRRSLDGTVAEHGKWRIGGKKQQFVFDFGSDAVIEEFRAGIAVLTGMRPEKIAILGTPSEAVRGGCARLSGTPQGSRRFQDFRGPSRASRSRDQRLCHAGARPHPKPRRARHLHDRTGNPDLANIYQSKDALLLNEELGDMIVFFGSTIFHERVRPRGTAVLYIKINDENLDPLGEDIYSTVKQQAPGALPVSA